MTGIELSNKLNYMGMERDIRALALKDGLASKEELATLLTLDVCNLIAEKYELVYSEDEELGLVKKERIPDYIDIVYVVAR